MEIEKANKNPPRFSSELLVSLIERTHYKMVEDQLLNRLISLEENVNLRTKDS